MDRVLNLSEKGIKIEGGCELFPHDPMACRMVFCATDHALLHGGAASKEITEETVALLGWQICQDLSCG